MESAASPAATLTIVTSEIQGDLHVFVSDEMTPQTIFSIASNLSNRVHQAVHIFHDKQLSKYRLCPVPSDTTPRVDLYGEFWCCCEPLFPQNIECSSKEEPQDIESLEEPSPTTQRIPRPCNSWILYRQAKSKVISKTQPGCTAAQMSTIIAGMWRAEPAEVKAQWQDMAKREEQLHSELYPEYKYSSKKKPAKA